jgi:O-antigen ligase
MQISDSKYSLALVWLTIATSSIVFIEPAPTDILSILALGLFFVFGMRIPPGFGAGGFFIGIYLVGNVVASALSPEPLDALRSMSVRFYMAASCLLFICLIYENPGKVLRVVWSAYIVAALIAVGAGFIGYYGPAGVGEQFVEFGRVRALFKDPNVYGPFIVPVAMFALARAETASQRQMVGYTVLLAVMAFGLLLGFSRGSWINFVVALTLYFIIRIRTQRSAVLRRRVILTGLALLFGSIIVVAGAASTDRVQEMLEKRMKVVQYYDTGEGGRLTRQMEVLKEIMVTPIGIGSGQSEQEYNFSKAPHQLYLHVLIEAGWIGGFAFFAFLLFTLYKGGRYFRLATNVDGVHIAAYTCVVGILAQSFFIDSTHWRHLFLLIAMVWGPLLYWENHRYGWRRAIQIPATPAADQPLSV